MHCVRRMLTLFNANLDHSRLNKCLGWEIAVYRVALTVGSGRNRTVSKVISIIETKRSNWGKELSLRIKTCGYLTFLSIILFLLSHCT